MMDRPPNQAELEAKLQEIGHRLASIQGEVQTVSVAFRELCQQLKIPEESAMSQQVSPAVPEKAETKKVTPEEVAKAPRTVSEEAPRSSKVSLKEKLVRGPSGGWEQMLGVQWFSRLGIIITVMGLAMGLNYSFQYFSKELKLLTGLIVALLLWFGGSKLFQKFPLLGRVIQSGGLAVGYLTLYGMFFFPEVQLFDAPMAGIAALLAYVYLMIVLSHQMKSLTMAFLALGLGYYTSSYSGFEVIAFFSTVSLGLAAMVLRQLNPKWHWLVKASLLGALGTYLYWDSKLSTSGPVNIFSLDQGAIGYLWVTFAMYHLAALLPKNKGDMALNFTNTFAFFVLLEGTISVTDDGWLAFILCAIQIASLWVMHWYYPEKESRRMRYSSLVLGVLMLGLATINRLEGPMEPAVLASEAMAMALFSKRGLYPRILHWVSMIFFAMAWVTIMPWWHHEEGLLYSGIWCYAVTLLSQHQVYGHYPRWLRFVMLGLVSFLFWMVLLDALDDQWYTASFAVTGLALIVTGFKLPEKLYRWVGLVWMGVAMLTLIVHDLAELDLLYKTLAFVAMGLCLLAASFGYNLLSQREKS